MNKPDLIRKIKSLETLTNTEKADLIALLNNTKKYGLVWEDKPEEVEKELLTKLPVLQEVTERRILAVESEQGKVTPIAIGSEQGKVKNEQPELFDSVTPKSLTGDEAPSPFGEGVGGEVRKSVGGEVPNHILIEGDNLHALTALTFTHEGKIDVIYIDPPYNTGKKDEFRYNDDWVVKEDSFRHSRWLSFMYKRLKIAKGLLNETGIVFISIDDNEQSQLKLLCDEVFGEDNQMAIIIIQSNKRGQTYKDIAKTHEYLLCYTKRPDTGLSEIEKTEDDLNYFDDIGQFSIRELRNRNPKFGRFNRPNLFFPFYISTKQSDVNGFCLISLIKTEKFSIEVFPFNSEGKESCWRWSAPLVNKMNTKDISTTPIIAKQKRDGGWNIYEKYRKTTERVKSIWDEKEVISEKGSVELKELGMGSLFAFPKPIGLIKKALTISTKENSIILDFFAGSGTTLHATMQLNAEDGGNRQCILVTNNENSICEEVTYERNKRVIQGYTNAKGAQVPGLTNNNLRYYKTGFVPSAKTEVNRRLLTSASTELLMVKEDCYNDITQASGFDASRCCICTNDRGKYLVVVFHSRLQHEVVGQLCLFIQNIAFLSEKVRVYAFSPETEVLIEDFYAVADKINAVPLPDAIYNAYRATFKTLRIEKKNYRNTAPETDQEAVPEDAASENQTGLFNQNGEEQA